MNQRAAGGEQDGRAVDEHRFFCLSVYAADGATSGSCPTACHRGLKHTRDPYGVSMVALYCGPSSLPRSYAFQVGWAAQRGPVLISHELGPFPGSLPPNPACPLSRHRALQRFMPRARLSPSRRTLNTTSVSCIAHPSWSLTVHRLCPLTLWSGSPGLQIGRT